MRMLIIAYALSTSQKLIEPTGRKVSGRLLLHLKKLLPKTGLSDEYKKRVVVVVCGLWPIAGPSQNKRKRVRGFISK